MGVATCIFCSDAIRWGAVKDDLQWAVGATSTHGLVLRISLKNVGAQARQIPIGFEGSAGLIYNVKITAHAPKNATSSKSSICLP